MCNPLERLEDVLWIRRRCGGLGGSRPGCKRSRNGVANANLKKDAPRDTSGYVCNLSRNLRPEIRQLLEPDMVLNEDG